MSSERGAARLQPFRHTAELPSPVLPGLSSSFLQVLNQCFRLGLNRSHAYVKDFLFLFFLFSREIEKAKRFSALAPALCSCLHLPPACSQERRGAQEHDGSPSYLLSLLTFQLCRDISCLSDSLQPPQPPDPAQRPAASLSPTHTDGPAGHRHRCPTSGFVARPAMSLSAPRVYFESAGPGARWFP